MAQEPGNQDTSAARRFAPFFALNIVAGLALIEPAMGHLKSWGTP